MCGICFYRVAFLTGLKGPHPMLNLSTDNKLGAFSLAGQKKIPLNLAECVDTQGDALDAGSDSCSWYWNKASQCGNYDDHDFTASVMCCACGGGRTTEEEISLPEPSNMCIDTQGDAYDAGHDSCGWYWNNPSRCGSYDDDDFTASEMCCACGGGRTPEEEIRLPKPLNTCIDTNG